MATEVQADPVELSRLASQVLSASQRLGDAWRAAQDSLSIPVSAYGDSVGARGVHAAHEAVAEDADVTNGRVVGVLEGDVDRLLRVAFAYQRADQEAAARNERAHRGGAGSPGGGPI
jgi:hypothetical protein